MRVIALLVVVVACSDPTFRIVYRVADGTAGQSCGIGATCSTLPMPCDSVLHLRIQSPSDPIVPHVSLCEAVPAIEDRNLCAIAGMDLPEIELPREPLEIQVTVWPRDAVLDTGADVDDPGDDRLDCGRAQVQFDAVDGFPTVPGPAFGGRAFYQPGDREVVVTLGCTDAALVSAPACSGVNALEVVATVLDFESLPITVSSDTAEALTVMVGEPREMNGEHELSVGDAEFLLSTATDPPAWGGQADLELQDSVCLQVDEDDGLTVRTLRCQRTTPDVAALDLAGVRVSKATLAEILEALGLEAFPEEGMTLGIVVDPSGNPLAGVTVNTVAPDGDPATIEYLNPNRTGIAPGNQTTSSGIFVSRDAPYRTTFSVNTTPTLETALGGRVRNRLTVVHFDPSGIGE